MRAEIAAPYNMVRLTEVPCAGCMLAEGHSADPDMISVQTRSDGQIETRLEISSNNGHLRTTELALKGIVRRDDVLKMLNSPRAGALEPGRVACNGLCARLVKEQNDGREEI